MKIIAFIFFDSIKKVLTCKVNWWSNDYITVLYRSGGDMVYRESEYCNFHRVFRMKCNFAPKSLSYYISIVFSIYSNI